MEYLRPQTWREALAVKAERPDVVPICGGTDVMVEINFAVRRPRALLDLSRLPEIQSWEHDRGQVRLGAGVTYTRILNELSGDLPALASASRTVGSPQIRNRGTVGGNLATASPAGDAHPPLLATGAVVRAESLRGTRSILIQDFFTGPKQHALASDELIHSIEVPSATGPQCFSKVGTRNAMVIAVVSFAIVLDTGRRRIGTGIGSAGPTPLPAAEAASYLTDWAHQTGCWDDYRPIPPAVLDRFADMVSAAARPIDDVRGSASYRRHSLGVLARRTLTWAWSDLAKGLGG